MTENMKAFNEALSQDEDLRREFGELLESLRTSRMEAILGFAESHGLALAAEDFVREPSAEISEEELKVVTGGMGLPGDQCSLFGVDDEPMILWY